MDNLPFIVLEVEKLPVLEEKYAANEAVDLS
jgi:hypothetical protein